MVRDEIIPLDEEFLAEVGKIRRPLDLHRAPDRNSRRAEGQSAKNAACGISG
jgi:hypothetical protein